MDIELKKCPFCGGDAQINEDEIYGIGFFAFVRCETCGARGPSVGDLFAQNDGEATNGFSAEQARLLWNIRNGNSDGKDNVAFHVGGEV